MSVSDERLEVSASGPTPFRALTVPGGKPLRPAERVIRRVLLRFLQRMLPLVKP